MPDLHNDDLFNSICTKLASYGETSSEVIDLLYKQVWSVLSKVAPIRFASEEIDRLYNESGSFKDLFHISLFISFDIIYTYVSRLLNDLDVELGNYDLPYGFNKQIEKIADQL